MNVSQLRQMNNAGIRTLPGTYLFGRVAATVGGCALVMLTGCTGRFPIESTAQPSGSPAVVIVSAAGRVLTSTPVGATTRVPPTPTLDPSFSTIFTPLVATGLATMTVQTSPTVDLRPTRTPALSVTPFPTFVMPPTAQPPQFSNPPTRTPGPPPNPPTPRATLVPTRMPTITPIDPNEVGGVANSDLAHAIPILINTNVAGLLTGPKAVDVYSFEVTNEDDTILVTLTGQDVEWSRLYLISPGKSQASFGRPLGSIARQIRYPVKGDLGTWYVEVSADGKRAPRGGYTVRVESRPVVPTPIRT